MSILETKRLFVRHAVSADDQFFMKLMNSEGWLNFIGDRNIRTTEDARQYISSLNENYTKYGFGLFVVCDKSTQKPIGINGFIQRDYLKHPDLGFAFLPEYEGKGFAFESSRGLLTFGQNSMSLKQVHAITTQANARSIALLTKLGFSSNGIVQPDGESLLLYSLQL